MSATPSIVFTPNASGIGQNLTNGTLPSDTLYLSRTINDETFYDGFNLVCSVQDFTTSLIGVTYAVYQITNFNNILPILGNNTINKK